MLIKYQQKAKSVNKLARRQQNKRSVIKTLEGNDKFQTETQNQKHENQASKSSYKKGTIKDKTQTLLITEKQI